MFFMDLKKNTMLLDGEMFATLQRNKPNIS